MSDRDQPMRSSMCLDDHLPAASAIKPRHRLHACTPGTANMRGATASSDIDVDDFLDTSCPGHVSFLA
jgi:hypothetical protein